MSYKQQLINEAYAAVDSLHDQVPNALHSYDVCDEDLADDVTASDEVFIDVQIKITSL